MIRLKLVPESGGRLPYEATDHKMVAGVLKAADNIPEQAEAPISGWEEVSRILPGSKEYLELRVPGQVGDYPGNSLDAIAGAITTNMGVMAHPEGWTTVEQEE